MTVNQDDKKEDKVEETPWGTEDDELVQVVKRGIRRKKKEEAL
jgi:hypothetical protein